MDHEMSDSKSVLQDPEDLLDLEDTLSLCDLPLYCQDSEPEPEPQPGYVHYPNFPPDGDYCFEFCTTTPLIIPAETSPVVESVIFCGKTISTNRKEPQEDDVEEEAIDPFGLYDPGRSLIPRSAASLTNNNKGKESLGLVNPKTASSLLPATGIGRYRTGGSRKHKVLIGLARIPQEMELSEMKRRQSKRRPVTMFPVAGGDKPAAAGNAGCWGGLWGCRAHFGTVLAKASLCCFPRL